ncbi:MAG: hypothetical protein R3C14_08600 [Caldilineaceae bacterium]
MSFQHHAARIYIWLVSSVAALLALLLGFILFGHSSSLPTTPPSASELLIPTRVGATVATVVPTQVTSLLLTPKFALAPRTKPRPYSVRWRIGIGIPEFNPLLFAWPAARPGWYLNWAADLGNWATWQKPPGKIQVEPPVTTGVGMEFAPMIRVKRGKPRIALAQVAQLAQENPGLLWLIGNEPDVRWQDNTTPEAYAIVYHDLYHQIKRADPSAQVAIGGISQVTPLRLAYLERIWTFYHTLYGETMPVDVWNMHAFVLREEANSWGVDIPPGFADVQHGVLWEVADHANLRLVENQVRLMRWWMAKHQQRDKPLVITEYGILMPADYGFPPEMVATFMRDSFELLRTLQDPMLGYPADHNHLVQRWIWFSTRYHLYPTGDLFDETGQPLLLMQTLQAYLAAYETADD